MPTPPSPASSSPTHPAPATPAEESARHYRDSLARALGPAVLDALANPDVDEIYVNPSGRLHLDTRSEGRLATSTLLLPEQVLRFLNLVASRPALQAELPLELFRNARLQGFVPPLAAAPVFNLRKPPAVVYTLDHYVEAGILAPRHRAAARR